jgi:hypothetical protein
MENVVGFEVAAAFLDSFGGVTMDLVRASHDAFANAARNIVSS